jgi:HD-GYP domain-containing protein (c-di-GMP phosphodiesterase class II)
MLEMMSYSPATLAHSIRVALLCVDMGLENNVNAMQLYMLGCAALLHDNGKKEIPLEIIEKPRDLSEAEMGLVRQHPRIGAQMVREFGEPLMQIILQLHEYQGEPYPRSMHLRRAINRAAPDRRKKPLIYIRRLAQILAVADQYDSLRSARAYKPAQDRAEAAQILRLQYTGDPLYLRQVLNR